MIRGEKVTFSKQDIASLDQMPSSRVDDPLIVHCPPLRGRSHLGHVAKITFVFAVFVAIIVGAIVGTVESGVFDEPLSQKAQLALDAAIGPRYKAEVGSTVVRFTRGLRLALVANNVNVVDQQSGKHLSTMGDVRLVLDPLALAEGRVVIADVQASGIALDTALLPSGDPIDPADLRVDSIPATVEDAFVKLDLLQRFVERGGTDAVQISGLAVKLARQDGSPPLSVVVDNLAFSRPDPTTLRLAGEVAIDGAVASLEVVARQEADKPSSFKATLKHLDLTPLTLAYGSMGEPRQGINGFADLSITAVRGVDGSDPTLDALIGLEPGTLYMDRDAQVLSGGQINLTYNSAHKTLEIAPSVARFENTTIPFSGALIDLDRLDPSAEKGFGVDFLIKGGTAAPLSSGEAPLSFDGQANGRYLAAAKVLQLDKIGVSTPLGSLFGSLRMHIAPGSPEISFGAQAEKLQTTAVKQLWPFWMATKARIWAEANIFGGTLTNSTISVFIPQGRLADAAKTGNLRLSENELHLAFDVTGMRLNVPGEIPPIRDLAGHFELKGPQLAVDVAGGKSYFPSGRSVVVGPSEFSIPSTYTKPLMAKMKLAVSGDADAMGELLSFKPLEVLQRTEFKPQDFSGRIDADVDATIGLMKDQNPPPPMWKAALQLQKVDILKPVSGRRITDLTGRIDADTQQVHLTAQAQIDNVAAQIDMVEPTGPDSTVKRTRVITATLTDQQRDKVVPGLSDIVNGPVTMEMTRLDDDRQGVKIDLTKAGLTIPWVGWSKGSGIPAKAEFEASGPNDQLSLKNFALTGDGFGANGDIVVGKGGLSSAAFTRVQLSSADDFALAIKRNKGAYDINVSGRAADVRPILARLKTQSDGGGGGDEHSMDATIHARLDKVVGFNDETLGNFNMAYATSGGRMSAADLSGVTDTGQAVVSELAKGENGTIHLTSGDAGSVARFADIYKHMKGGLLNLKLHGDGSDNWEGSIDIRNFSIVNEKRLQSIVSTPAGHGGQSLNTAVKQQIDATSQRFQRGFAHLLVEKGVVSVENGVVRGEQVGATFQGTIKDAKGNTDMTGTFMPAYGLNRLFAEVPIVGFLLGNGTDRGLIGITFKLTGNFDSPNLVINPLSVIAPGIFRQIFEFQ